MDKSGEQSLLVIIVMGLLLLTYVGGCMTGCATAYSDADDRWQREAVKQGAAAWVTDENGEPAWQWKAQEPQP